MYKNTPFIALFLLLSSCSGMEKSEKEKIRKLNEIKEPIYRLSSDQFAITGTQESRLRERYPWEKQRHSHLQHITKDFFRCRGRSNHPPIITNGKEPILDCNGIEEHGLPLKNGKENVSDVLIDLLNFIQDKLEKKVVITSGYQCTKHHLYVEKSPDKKRSKHLMGTEVDFYVQDLEENPFEVIKAIMEFYTAKERARDLAYMTNFFEGAKKRSKVYPCWMNKEIVIHLMDKNEGRDLDNNHPYSYICIELR